MSRSLLVSALACCFHLACAAETTSSAPPESGVGALSSARYAVIANLESSAFLGIWDASRAGDYDNGEAFEVASYSFVFAQGQAVIVAQNQSSDQILRFELGANGQLSPAGSLEAPPRSAPMDVVFAAEDKAYVSLLYGG